MDYFLELFLSGLTRGSIYALIALGYTMVYGIIQLINFAHGEIYMIGAFVALVVSGILTIYGFSGVSMSSNRVSGRMAARTWAGSEVSTNEDWTPNLRKCFSTITRDGP